MSKPNADQWYIHSSLLSFLCRTMFWISIISPDLSINLEGGCSHHSWFYHITRSTGRSMIPHMLVPKYTFVSLRILLATYAWFLLPPQSHGSQAPSIYPLWTPRFMQEVPSPEKLAARQDIISHGIIRHRHPHTVLLLTVRRPCSRIFIFISYYNSQLFPYGSYPGSLAHTSMHWG